jgi:hypothetical protein
MNGPKMCVTCSAMNGIQAKECWNCQAPFGQVVRYIDAENRRMYWLPSTMSFAAFFDGGMDLCAVAQWA